MSRGRKTIIALSSVALAAAVALGGGQAASANVVPTSSSSDLTSWYDDEQSHARSMAKAAAPYKFTGSYRIANGKNTVTVKMADASGGPDISVAVTNLRLQRYIAGTGWKTGATVRDYDGWHPTSDAASATVNCKAGAQYRAVYSVKFRGAASGSGTVTTSTWRCPS